MVVEDKSEEAADGRRARSERTRMAIVDALLALLAEGHPRPPAERIAERAGISRRALFNHFRDVEDLLAAAAERRIAQIVPTLRPLPVTGSLAERAAEVAAILCELYERVAPVRRAGLLAEPESKVIAERMQTARRWHRAAIEATFARELAAHPEPQRRQLAAVLAALTSFTLWDELTSRQELSPAETTEAMRRQIVATLR